MSFHKNKNINNSGYNVTASFFKGDGRLLTNLPLFNTTNQNLNTTQQVKFAKLNLTNGWGNVTINASQIIDGIIDFIRLPTLTNMLTLDWANITNKLASDFNYLVLSKWQNITGVPTVLTNFTNDIFDNSTLARIGDCPSGQWVQNITTGGVECLAPTISESDPQWTGNQSFYYNISNNYGFYNITNKQPVSNYTEDEIEAFIFDNDNTANLNVSGYNITTKNLVFQNDKNHVISDNSTCIIINGSTSSLRIC